MIRLCVCVKCEYVARPKVEAARHECEEAAPESQVITATREKEGESCGTNVTAAAQQWNGKWNAPSPHTFDYLC